MPYHSPISNYSYVFSESFNIAFSDLNFIILFGNKTSK